MKNKFALFFVLLLLIPVANAQESEAFTQIKKMLGTWEGTVTSSDGTVIETTSEYKLISNGGTIIESIVEDGVAVSYTHLTLPTNREV